MCGIIGIKIKSENKRKIIKKIRHIFDNQKSRGEQGAGYSILRGKEHTYMRFLNPHTMIQHLKRNVDFRKDDLVLLHHRIPTCTPNEPRFNHPILTKDNKMSLIHNGIISNAYSLEDSYKGSITTYDDKKYKFTDSEIILLVLQESLKDKEINNESIEASIKYLSTKIKGNLAIAFTISGSPKIWLFRKGNPLITYSDNKGNHYFSSEYPKNGFSTSNVLEDGEYGYIDEFYTKIGVLSHDEIERFNYHYKNEYKESKWKSFENEKYPKCNVGLLDFKSKKEVFDSPIKKYDLYLTDLEARNMRKAEMETPRDNYKDYFLEEVSNLKHPLLGRAKMNIMIPIIALHKDKFISKTKMVYLVDLIENELKKVFNRVLQENFLLFRKACIEKSKFDSLIGSTKWMMDEWDISDGFDILIDDYETCLKTELMAVNTQLKHLHNNFFGEMTKKEKKEYVKLFQAELTEPVSADYLEEDIEEPDKFSPDENVYIDLDRDTKYESHLEVLAAKQYGDSFSQYEELKNSYWKSGRYD